MLLPNNRAGTAECIIKELTDETELAITKRGKRLRLLRSG